MRSLRFPLLSLALLAAAAHAEDAAPAAPAATPPASAAPAAAATPASPAVATTPAAAPAAPVNAHLAAAQRLYQKLDLDAALAELQQAEAGASEDDTVQVLIYRGLIFSDEGKSADAADQFKRALAIRPWAEVPPETSPRIAKVFSETRKSIWGTTVKPPKKRISAATPPPANTPAAKPADDGYQAPPK